MKLVLKLNPTTFTTQKRGYFEAFVIISRRALGFSRYPEACCVEWLPRDTWMPKTTCGDRQQRDPQL